MWELRNRTPYAAERTIAVDKFGARSYVVVVKGTFGIGADGGLRLSDEQLQPETAPRYHGDPGSSSLIYEQELVAGKPRTDFLLNAKAHSPTNSATEVTVGIRTPRGRKVLLVKGDRRWERSAIGTIHSSSPEVFQSMPIVYERTFGGHDRIDPDEQKHRLDRNNPVGKGFYSDNTHCVGDLLPNIEIPGSTRHVAGFGALCSHWEPRIRFQGTYDADWAASQKPLLPRDYDPQWLQCAPADQQFSPHLVGGEVVELFNLTKSGRLTFVLPKHYFAFATYVGQKRLQHRARLATIIVEPEYPRVIALWASALQCHHDIDEIDYTTISEKGYG